MDPAEAQDYSKVKGAILNMVTITPETHCQRLCQERFVAGDCPWAIAQQMKEHCWCWLATEGWTGNRSLNRSPYSNKLRSSLHKPNNGC